MPTKRTTLAVILVSACGSAFSQSPDAPPKFEVADVHVSAKTQNPFPRPTTHGDRYEVKTATIVDLIRLAYGFDTDKILGGPNWLEMDRFDIVAKMPPATAADAQKLMLQSLLEERFKLVVHKDTQPLPTYALGLGKKPQLKEADGQGESGCKMQSGSSAPAEGGVRIMMSNNNGAATTLNLGPDMTLQYNCRNMTMAAFAEGLRGMMGTSLGPNPVLDETGLKGMWNFDVKWSFTLIGPMIQNQGDKITVFDAVEKQLGLKLEQKQVPTPVMVVDSVLRKPTDNPPGLAEALPMPAAPTEFDVASVKPADPNSMMGRFQNQTGGRLNAEGMPLRFYISRAFNSTSNDMVVGLPSFADSERFDIIAKAATSASLDNEMLAPLMRKLLVDRFKMTFHTEERPLQAYSLTSVKPKMKKADPASRTNCKTPPPSPGLPPGSRSLVCQNITMEQFAERLQGMGQGVTLPVLDATGIEGGWDFTLTFSQIAGMNFGGRGGDAGQPGAPSAADPTGGMTVFEALEKQLGLKLEAQKRTVTVTVIDHIEQKPTDN